MQHQQIDSSSRDELILCVLLFDRFFPERVRSRHHDGSVRERGKMVRVKISTEAFKIEGKAIWWADGQRNK